MRRKVSAGIADTPSEPAVKPWRLGLVSAMAAVTLVAVGVVVIVGRLGSGPSVASHGPSMPWSLPRVPSPGMQSVLNSVACSAPTACTAVGSYSPDGVAQPALVDSWDGTSWSVVPTPHAGPDTTLQSIACTSRSYCVAVGYSGVAGSPVSHRPFAESWTGSSWSAASLPSSGSPSALQAVVCTSPTSCTAVGFSTTPGAGLPAALVEHWDGAAWSAPPVPSASGSVEGEFNAVACGSPRSCVAVGSYSVTGDAEDFENHVLVESWDGFSWSVAPSLSPGGWGELGAIGCVTTTACVAVGSYSPTGDIYKPDEQRLVEAWSGRAWSLVPNATSSGDQNLLRSSTLQSVSCDSMTSCVAVGSSRDAPVLETWHDAFWSATGPPTHQGTFKSVACPTPTWCVAVGELTSSADPNGKAMAAWWRP